MGRASLIGTVLGGSYEIERELGGGGMGAVYQARHLRTGRAYAVKVLLPDLTTDEEALGRFRREAETASRLGHAGIVGIHDFDQEPNGTTYIVMDYLEGEDLEARLSRAGGLPWPEAFGIFVQVSEALAAAHDLGIVHRDLKPANIFLARTPGSPERAVILDFGLAKVMDPTPAMTQLTQTGMVMGTPQYMSPEQANGHGVDHRTDIYALACVLFQMLAGAPPFDAVDMPSIFAAIMTEAPPRVSAKSKTRVPPGLDAVIARALAKDPDARYSSVREMVEAIRALGPPSEDAAPADLSMASMPAAPGGAITAPSAHPALSPSPMRHDLLTPRPMATQPAVNPIVPPASAASPSATQPALSPIAPGDATGPGYASMPGEASAPGLAAPSAGGATPGFAASPGTGGVAQPVHGAPPPKPRRLGGLAFFALVSFFGAFTLVASAAFTWWLVSSRRASDGGDAARAADAGTTDAGAITSVVAGAGPTKVGPVAVATPPLPPLPPLPPPPPEITSPPPPVRARDAAPLPTPAKDAGAKRVVKSPPAPPSQRSTSERLERANRAISRGDFRGCLRELRGASATSRVLTTRLACAQSAGDRAEVARTCRAIRNRYPRSAQAAGCGLLTGLPVKLPF